jgi:hypothetical protein
MCQQPGIEIASDLKALFRTAMSIKAERNSQHLIFQSSYQILDKVTIIYRFLPSLHF